MRITRLKLAVLVIMSLFGLGAALEVFFTYYLLGQSLPLCQSEGFLDCSRVLGSTYSQIFGIPLELFAAAYFIINLGLVYVIAFGSERVFQRAIGAIFIWRFLGLMIVPYLVFIELFIIHALCIYCTMMHVAIVADFIIISYLIFYKGGIGAQVLESLPKEGVSTIPSKNLASRNSA
ncbi:MAG TPA: vitamin K epoxide reductase family protein [Nitrososphaerales archaeon]|nr:vitamin K epoxide reductase family protein [Nitrososphaerales archaeon]